MKVATEKSNFLKFVCIKNGQKVLTTQRKYVILSIIRVEGLFFCTEEVRIYILEVLKNMRVKITLACSECKQRNYDTMKNKKNDTADRLEMNKYCPILQRSTLLIRKPNKGVFHFVLDLLRDVTQRVFQSERKGLVARLRQRTQEKDKPCMSDYFKGRERVK